MQIAYRENIMNANPHTRQINEILDKLKRLSTKTMNTALTEDKHTAAILAQIVVQIDILVNEYTQEDE